MRKAGRFLSKHGQFQPHFHPKARQTTIKLSIAIQWILPHIMVFLAYIHTFTAAIFYEFTCPITHIMVFLAYIHTFTAAIFYEFTCPITHRVLTNQNTRSICCVINMYEAHVSIISQKKKKIHK